MLARAIGEQFRWRRRDHWKRLLNASERFAARRQEARNCYASAVGPAPATSARGACRSRARKHLTPSLAPPRSAPGASAHLHPPARSQTEAERLRLERKRKNLENRAFLSRSSLTWAKGKAGR